MEARITAAEADQALRAARAAAYAAEDHFGDLFDDAMQRLYDARPDMTPKDRIRAALERPAVAAAHDNQEKLQAQYRDAREASDRSRAAVHDSC